MKELPNLKDDWAELSQTVDRLLEETRKMKKALTWSCWESHYISMPRRINGRWYWRTTVYRRERFGPGGMRYQYGDQFDALRDIE